MMKKYFFLIGWALLLISVPSLGLHAQQILTGTVTDGSSPLPGVSIMVKGTTQGTQTDTDGNFSIPVTEGAVLEFSFLGFKTKDVTVRNQETLNIVLEADAAQLDEVVVTALDVKRSKRELGYAVESIEGDVVTKSASPNVVNALQGKMAGVNVVQPNGVDGGSTRITIRGNNSITGDNQPLIIVDGVPIQNDVTFSSVGSGKDWGTGVNNINPYDIETMTVLKGPNAAALYGSRGANGVILITTKKGEVRKGIGVDYTFTNTYVKPYRFRDMQTMFGGGSTGLVNIPDSYVWPTDEEGNKVLPPVSFYGSGGSWGPRADGTMIKWWDGQMRPYKSEVGTFKDFFETGNNQVHNLSLSGGGEKGTIRFSATRQDNDTFYPNTNYEQTTLNLGSSLNISQKIRADVGINYIDFNRHNSPNLGDNDQSIGKNFSYNWNSTYKWWLEKDNWANPDGSRNEDGYPRDEGTGLGRTGSFFWNLYNDNEDRHEQRLIGSIALNYQIAPWLSALVRLGMDNNSFNYETKNYPYDRGGLQGYYATTQGREVIQNHELMLTATKEDIVEGLGITAAVGGTLYSRERRSNWAESGNRNWRDPFKFTVNNYTGPTAPGRSETFYDKQINSVQGYIDFNYKKYLFLQLTGRNDWTSTLPSDAWSYFYPSISTSFVFSELLPETSRILSFGKVRASYAAVASDTDPYQLDPVFNGSTWGGQATHTLPGTIPPQGLKPVRTRAFEAGLVLGFLNDRINLDFAYYRKRSYDQILNSPVPISSGANFLRINTGELSNRGWELILNTVPVRTEDFMWELSFNMNRNRNFVEKLGSGAESIELSNIWGASGPAIEVREGQEYGTIVGWDYLYDEAGNKIIDDDGIWYKTTGQRVPVGNASPDWMGGLATSLRYKNLSLSALVDIKMGGDTYFGTYVTGVTFGQSPETLSERLGEGLPFEGEDGAIGNYGVIKPGVYENGEVNDKVVHYRYKYADYGGWGQGVLTTPGVFENSWVNMRELILTYDLPQNILGSTGFVQNLSLSLIGRNLFYIYDTAPDNINPEGTNGSGNAQGFEWGAMPAARTFGFSLRASF